MPTEIKIEGLREFQAAMRAVDKELPKQLRLAFNRVVSLVVDAARPRAPVRSGRLASSIRALSTQRMGQVAEGSARVPYAGFIDFGGHVGIHRSVARPFLKTGRILYPAYKARKPEIEAALERELRDLVTRSGL